MLSDVPVRHGYAEITATVASGSGWRVRGEVGYRPTNHLGAFAFAEASSGTRMAGAGLRWLF
ncbi:hypothetical protein D7X32_09050 [Corallococcus carmarthensis]|uniref:Autotransporter outer membrane beta-barrel domain-containing protein n=1 Tax=Corallococcus carmarthensis TaxID=2316728 RepID=A0A3A8KLG2_9BACT|nr:hypothetical protein D7X32_09050 [Corallococcus carmarthensis]